MYFQYNIFPRPHIIYSTLYFKDNRLHALECVCICVYMYAVPQGTHFSPITINFTMLLISLRISNCITTLMLDDNTPQRTNY